MRKQFMCPPPAQPRRAVVHAIASRLARISQALVRRRVQADARDLDQRVRETGEW